MKKYPLVLVLLLPLTACALWMDFEPPQTETPQHWATQADTSATTTWPDNEWWKSFKSEPLTAQIEQASSENYDMAAAVARVRQADAQVQINGAALLPSINATGAADRNRTAGTKISKPHIANSYNGSLSASYELDFWGKNHASSASAIASADASRFDQESVKLTTLSSVATTYFNILGTKERLKVANENLSNATSLLDTIRKRYKAGIATALDMAQQESVVATQRAAIPPLEQQLQQYSDAQAILLGKMPENMNIPPDNLGDIALPMVTSGLPSELLERRPDVRNAESQLEAAHADIIVARTAFFPSISLTTSGGYQSAAFANLFRPDSMLWSLGSSISQPIFEGGQLSGELELKKARYDELLADYRKAVLAAFSDVEDALVGVKQTTEEEAAQELAVKTARNAYQLTLQQLHGGIIDITTVLNTQKTLFSAEDALVQAKLSHLQAIVSLYKALGGGWKADTPAAMPAAGGDTGII